MFPKTPAATLMVYIQLNFQILVQAQAAPSRSRSGRAAAAERGAAAVTSTTNDGTPELKILT